MGRLVACPSCKRKLKLPDEGGVFECSGCSQQVRLGPKVVRPRRESLNDEADDDAVVILEDELPGRRRTGSGGEAASRRRSGAEESDFEPAPRLSAALLIGIGGTLALVAVAVCLTVLLTWKKTDKGSDVKTAATAEKASAPMNDHSPPVRPRREDWAGANQAAIAAQRREQQERQEQQARDEEAARAELARQEMERQKKMAAAQREKATGDEDVPPQETAPFERSEFSTAIELAREATVLVTTPRGIGSAFCVSDIGVFVTNAHVVDGYTLGDAVSLVLRSGQDDEKRLEGKIARLDEDQDLAIITVRGSQFVALKLGETNGLRETDEILAFGFPFGEARSATRRQNPSLSVNVGRITSMRREDGALKAMQIDALVNPGNAGGPVTNREGQVVGIVQAGVENSGIHYAIPVDRVRTLLSEPLVEFTTPAAVGKDELATPQQFRAVITPAPWAINEEFAVSLTVKGLDDHTVAMKNEEGTYVASLPLVVPSEQKMLRLVGDFETGRVEGLIPKTTRVFVKDKMIDLDAVASMKRQPVGVYVIRMRNSERNIVGKLAARDLRSVPVTVAGNDPVRMDLTKAQRLAFPSDEDADQFELVLEVCASDGEKLATVTRSIGIKGARNSGDADRRDEAGTEWATNIPESIKLPPASERVNRLMKVQLPSAIADVCFGAAGRYMICTLPQTQQIAVIDLAVAKVIKYVPLPSSNVVVAAGLRDMLVAIAENNIVSRYDLATFTRRLTKEVHIGSPISVLSMGNASSGPAAIGGTSRTTGRVNFLDVKNLRLEQIQMPVQNRSRIEVGRGGLRASADGTTWGYWRYTSPSGVYVYRLLGKKFDAFYRGTSLGHIIPSPDGSVIYTAGGPFATNMKMDTTTSTRTPSGGGVFPALHGHLYLRVSGLGTSSITRQNKARVTLHTQGSTETIATLPDVQRVFDNRSTSDRYFRGPMTMEKRLVLAPAFGVMALTFDTYVEVRPFSLLDVLKRGGTDYLVVISQPETVARVGATYSYTPKTLSKNGSVRMKLSAGPETMKMDAQGEIRWKPTNRHRGTTNTVVVTVSDASGQEVMHTFKVRCE